MNQNMNNGVHLRMLTAACLCFMFSLFTRAEVRLPQMVRDSMILQRDAKVNIRGWAAPKENVTLGLKMQITELDISVYPKEHNARERTGTDADTVSQ
ncbi:hypothetical protein BH20BAC1_BH20BAC1_13110 [soil metagenome]